METSVDFKSSLFKPFLPESSQVNPHVYGAELSYWLCKKLAEKNIITTYPNNEDWGWFIEYFVGDNEYWLCCSNSDKSGEAWRCFLRPQPKHFWGIKKAPITSAKRLLTALREILIETDGILDIKWSNDYDP